MAASTRSRRLTCGFAFTMSAIIWWTTLTGFSTVDFDAFTFDPFGAGFVSTCLVSVASVAGAAGVPSTGAVVVAVVS